LTGRPKRTVKLTAEKRKPTISRERTTTRAIAKRNKRLEKKRVLMRPGNGNGSGS
jgi:hypothetical protein